MKASIHKALARRNAAAARVSALEDKLYNARKALRDAERTCWSALPDGCSISLSPTDPWTLAGRGD